MGKKNSDFPDSLSLSRSLLFKASVDSPISYRNQAFSIEGSQSALEKTQGELLFLGAVWLGSMHMEGFCKFVYPTPGPGMPHRRKIENPTVGLHDRGFDRHRNRSTEDST